MTKSVRIVRVPLLERVVLAELSDRWGLSEDDTLARIIREAAKYEIAPGQPELLSFSEALKAMIYCENRVDELAQRDLELERIILDGPEYGYAVDDQVEEQVQVQERLRFYRRLVNFLTQIVNDHMAGFPFPGEAGVDGAEPGQQPAEATG